MGALNLCLLALLSEIFYLLLSEDEKREFYLRYLIACRIGPISIGCKPVIATRLIQHQGKFLLLPPHFHFLWHWPGFVTRKTWCILLLKSVLQVFPPIRIVLRVVLNTADSQGTNYFVCVFHARNSQLSRLYVSLHVILQLTA